MIVCKWDVDKINPQVYPIILKEEILSNPEMVRPEQPALPFPNPNSDQLPGQPQNLVVQLATLGPGLELTWDGPDNTGSSPILGYKVYRYYLQIIDPATTDIFLTNSPAGIYLDTNNVDTTSYYAYQVSAYSEIGEGPKSDIFYWPSIQDSHDYIATDNYDLISTDDGAVLIL